jgi:thioredoxin-dependent peroxiredoxin
MVELRKRKTPPPAPEKAPKKSSGTSKLAKVKNAVIDKVESVIPGDKAASSSAPAVGSAIDLASFGGEIENHEGNKVTLKQLVDESKAGVVLFTYPKASTPGCEFSHFPRTSWRSDNSCRILQAPHKHVSSAMPTSL